MGRMYPLLVVVLWGLTLAQNAVAQSSVETTPMLPHSAATTLTEERGKELTEVRLGNESTTIANFAVSKGPKGADYHPMEGGTELKTPLPLTVPIKQEGELSAGDPEYPCFGTMSGNSSSQRHILLTSSYCNVEGHIDKMYAAGGIEDIKIKKHRVSPSLKEQVIALTHPFTVDQYTYAEDKNLNATVFTMAGDLILDVKEYQKIIGNSASMGVVLGSRPYKAGRVSLDQTNCSGVYKVRKEPEWPENIPEGVFCILGTPRLQSVKNDGVKFKPGVPCRDSVGSPVLVEGPSGFNRILGIVIWYNCDWLPPDAGDIPHMAVATAAAYAFNYTRIIPSPRPNFTWPSFTSPRLPWFTTRLTEAPKPYSGSPSIAFGRAMYLTLVVILRFPLHSLAERPLF